MTRKKKSVEQFKQEDKTMSTLQLWQHQMSALQRASRRRPADDSLNSQNASRQKNSETLHSESSVIYPHLP